MKQLTGNGLSQRDTHEAGRQESSPAAEGSCAGEATAPAHHGEILQGVFETGCGLRRGLVTLPCPIYESQAVIRLAPGRGGLAVTPSWKRKAWWAARLTLGALGHPHRRGRLVIRSNISVARGLGSSTSDVCATVRAVADALGRRISPAEVAHLAVRAEHASDATMFDRPLLFGHRDGEAIEHYPDPRYRLRVLGFSTQPKALLHTLAMPRARYTTWEIEAFRALRGLLRRALADGDAEGIGRVATASASLNQRHLPIPRFEELRALATSAGALGIQVAHSGCVAGILIDPSDPRCDDASAAVESRLARLGMPVQQSFEVSDP